MTWKTEWKYLVWIIVGFLACFYLPVGNERFDNATFEALHLVKWYAQEQFLSTMILAFFIAGAIGTFVSQNSILKYLGAKANRLVAYLVASVSGAILTVCSCTILPLFAGIYRMGAGLGPACVFLYSGPAINVLAIIMTASILGPELGIARVIGAIALSIVIGLLMAFLFHKEEQEKIVMQTIVQEESKRPLWQTILFFATMLSILVFSSLGCSNEACAQSMMYATLTALCGIALGLILVLWFGMKWWKVLAVAVVVTVLVLLFPGSTQIPFIAAILGLSAIISIDKGECGDWFASTWSFLKTILPFLFIGVLLAGFLLGRAGEEGMIPSEWVVWAVGDNSFRAVFFASVVGALMYFATCTEVPVVQALIGAGMGNGPALALLLAGPVISLPSMLITYSILGFRKTFAFVCLVIVSSMVCGLVFGYFYQ